MIDSHYGQEADQEHTITLLILLLDDEQAQEASCSTGSARRGDMLRISDC